MIAHVGLISFTVRTLKKTPILSSVYKNGVELSTDSPEYDKGMLILSASPAQDPINVAKQINFNNHSVGNTSSTGLKFTVPTYENGLSSYLLLDRFPTKTQSFMGIIQADSLWDCKTQRKKVLGIGYKSVCLYPGNKCR